MINLARLWSMLAAMLSIALASLPDGASPWVSWGLGILAAGVAVLAGEAPAMRQGR